MSMYISVFIYDKLNISFQELNLLQFIVCSFTCWQLSMDNTANLHKNITEMSKDTKEVKCQMMVSPAFLVLTAA